MIRSFDENGYLPPGVHAATLDEIAARFGQESELRRVELESLRWLVEAARRAGVLKPSFFLFKDRSRVPARKTDAPALSE